MIEWFKKKGHWFQRKVKPRMNAENAMKFVRELQDVVASQILLHPERFIPAIRDEIGEYSATTAAHLLEKFKERRVVVLNDTVSETARRLLAEGETAGVEEVYRYLGIDVPTTFRPHSAVEQADKLTRTPVKREFFGC